MLINLIKKNLHWIVYLVGLVFYPIIISNAIASLGVIWLMFLVVIGTLAQRDQGLYIAQQKYFSSWFTWFSIFPVPSGKLIMSIMVINLSCYFLRPHIFEKNNEDRL